MVGGRITVGQTTNDLGNSSRNMGSAGAQVKSFAGMATPNARIHPHEGLARGRFHRAPEAALKWGFEAIPYAATWRLKTSPSSVRRQPWRLAAARVVRAATCPGRSNSWQ